MKNSGVIKPIFYFFNLTLFSIGLIENCNAQGFECTVGVPFQDLARQLITDCNQNPACFEQSLNQILEKAKADEN